MLDTVLACTGTRLLETKLLLTHLQAALEGKGTASTNEDAEATEPAQKKGKKKATKASAS